MSIDWGEEKKSTWWTLPPAMLGRGLEQGENMIWLLAPVVTATPGPLEIVQSGHDGLVVPARDSQAIEQALERLLTERTLLDKLRRNARAKAQAYGWSRIARQRLQLYEEFLQARRPGE